MADQQSRGGANPQTGEQHQAGHANQQQPESSDAPTQGRKSMDRPRPDDESLAPESGDRKATGNS